MAEPIDSFVIYGSKEEVELKRQQMGWVMCQQLLDRFPVRDEFSKVEQQVFENESVALSTQG